MNLLPEKDSKSLEIKMAECRMILDLVINPKSRMKSETTLKAQNFIESAGNEIDKYGVFRFWEERPSMLSNISELLTIQKFFRLSDIYREKYLLFQLIEASKRIVQQSKNPFIFKPSIPLNGGVLIEVRMDNDEPTLVSDPFFEILHNIPLSRIRCCEICKNIFWAKRSESATCSTPCLFTWRQRQYRQANRDEINKRRRENRFYKKKLATKKGEKNNGNL
ncbi:MAG TPA: hypothetical protein PKY82_01895 [Pyrinomonadaceae bacterium]|nr:hypothetical protein [Pyrinomonadaceae bacterium]